MQACVSTKFFNNDNGKTLFAKFEGIADGMAANFHTFCAVSGYFRSSGWFKLREKLTQTQKIKILVGINIDDIFKGAQRKGMLFYGDDAEAKRQYAAQFIEDVRNAGYRKEVEEGIIQLVGHIVDGKVEMRIHSSKNLHAKFYLCLPEKHNENSDGWVIMGSSNLTDSGLGLTQSPRYELNVAMKDYDDVAYCKSEFERLWNEGVPITADDIEASRKATHLGQNPTPFEVFMRVLIDLFGDQVEDDFSLALPSGMSDLKYQRDAVIQGYQMLRRYDGFFLADVVGLGKTVVATMIAKRFIAENGARTRMLIVYPPAVEDNWKDTFAAFGVTKRQARFVSNGSLHKVLDPNDASYLSPEEYDLVIVDESHGFRNTRTGSYEMLQRICKTPRPAGGHVPGSQKKVMLVTATALNNTPADLLSQIRLFQDDRSSTIDGVRDIAGFFSPLIRDYKAEMRKAKETGKVDTKAIDAIYAKIRRDVLEKIIVRRTRQNILNDPEYAADIAAQGIVFPKILPPNEILYRMDASLASLFKDTNRILSDGMHYARHRAIEILKPAYKAKYPNAKQVADILSSVFRVFMVKRLESSFTAFRKSLDMLRRTTAEMLKMFDEDSVLIIPDFDVYGYLEQGLTFEDIVTKAIELRGLSASDITYPASAFDPKFRELLEADLAVANDLSARWTKVKGDPKLDRFCDLLGGKLFDPAANPEGKLVVFSESTDTLEYLERELARRLGRSDILFVDSRNRASLKSGITANFDANIPKAAQRNDINILLCSDTLAEGVNLHRANIVVNYDSPWNATRLMQRIGRVNRIGSSAGEIRNYLFYPSDEGNKIIGLYEYSLIKMQGFHSALGEDSQIYSREELLREFELYDANPHDDMDDLLRFMRILQDLRKNHLADYERIKALPVKCRTVRGGKTDETLVYLANNVRAAFYAVRDGSPRQLSSIELLKRLEAKPGEPALPWGGAAQSANYAAVGKVLALFDDEETGDSGGAGGSPAEDSPPLSPSTKGASKQTVAAGSFLRKCARWAGSGMLPADLGPKIKDLESLVAMGRFVHLERELSALNSQYGKVKAIDETFAGRLADELDTLHATYHTSMLPKRTTREKPMTLIVSETITRE